MDKKEKSHNKITTKKGGYYKMSVLATQNKNFIVLDNSKFQSFLSSKKEKQIDNVLKKSQKIKKQIERIDT